MIRYFNLIVTDDNFSFIDKSVIQYSDGATNTD